MGSTNNARSEDWENDGKLCGGKRARGDGERSMSRARFKEGLNSKWTQIKMSKIPWIKLAKIDLRLIFQFVHRRRLFVYDSANRARGVAEW